MTNLRQAAEQALKVLEEINEISKAPMGLPLPAEIDGAMEALRQALTQPEREWVGLTDKERADWHSMGLVGVEIVAAHLKEKNGGN